MTQNLNPVRLAFIIEASKRGLMMTDRSSDKTKREPSRWRGRTEVLLLVLGGLILLIPTVAILLTAGG